MALTNVMTCNERKYEDWVYQGTTVGPNNLPATFQRARTAFCQKRCAVGKMAKAPGTRQHRKCVSVTSSNLSFHPEMR